MDHYEGDGDGVSSRQAISVGWTNKVEAARDNCRQIFTETTIRWTQKAKM